MKISVLVSVADILVQIYLYRYRQKYRLGEYICIGIGIGWTHIGPTLIQTLKDIDIPLNIQSKASYSFSHKLSTFRYQHERNNSSLMEI